MTYKQALNIGAEAVGAIKCTYATIYDADGCKLFSFQRVDGQYVWEPNEELSARIGQTALIRRPDLSQADTSAYYYNSVSKTGSVAMPDIPIVRATEYVDGTKRVPVYLTDAAKEWIEACCPRQQVIDVYNSKGKRVRTFYDLSGENKDKLESYLQHGYTCARSYNSERIYAVLDSADPVIYVKPETLVWSIDKLPENTELAEAKKKYEQARAILLASLPTALI